MKKQLFSDLLQTKTPSQLWRFFSISILFHCLMVFGLMQMDLSPPANAVSPKQQTVNNKPVNSSREYRDVRRSSEPEGVVDPGSYDYDNVNNESARNETAHNEPVDLTGRTGGTGEAVYRPNRRKSAGKRPANIIASNNVELITPPKPGEPAVARIRHEIKQNPWDINVEEYLKMYDKPFTDVLQKPVSRFGLKKRTKTYPTIKRYIEKNELPPRELVKIDEMVNYFQYDYPLPSGEHPFAVYTEIHQCPWNKKHLLLHVGFQAMIVPGSEVKKQKFIVASDMKIKVSFNKDTVLAYRLIGYGSRRPKLGNEKASWKHNRELKMGQSTTTLYELVPEQQESEARDIRKTHAASIKVDYLDPSERKQKQLAHKVFLNNHPEQKPSKDFQFAAGVARFGMMLKKPGKNHKTTLATLLEQTGKAITRDPKGIKKGFLRLLESYREMLK